PGAPPDHGRARSAGRSLVPGELHRTDCADASRAGDSVWPPVHVADPPGEGLGARRHGFFGGSGPVHLRLAHASFLGRGLIVTRRTRGRRRRRKTTVRYCNRSPFGWWLASYIERFEYDDEDKQNLDRRCLAWENTIVVRAKTRDEAYRKAVAIGRSGDPGGWS